VTGGFSGLFLGETGGEVLKRGGSAGGREGGVEGSGGSELKGFRVGRGSSVISSSGARSKGRIVGVPVSPLQ